MNSQAAKQPGLPLCVHVEKLWKAVATLPEMGTQLQNQEQSIRSGTRKPRSESWSGAQFQGGLE